MNYAKFLSCTNESFELLMLQFLHLSNPKNLNSSFLVYKTHLEIINQTYSTLETTFIIKESKCCTLNFDRFSLYNFKEPFIPNEWHNSVGSVVSVLSMRSRVQKKTKSHMPFLSRSKQKSNQHPNIPIT